MPDFYDIYSRYLSSLMYKSNEGFGSPYDLPDNQIAVANAYGDIIENHNRYNRHFQNNDVRDAERETETEFLIGLGNVNNHQPVFEEFDDNETVIGFDIEDLLQRLQLNNEDTATEFENEMEEEAEVNTENVVENLPKTEEFNDYYEYQVENQNQNGIIQSLDNLRLDDEDGDDYKYNIINIKKNK